MISESLFTASRHFDLSMYLSFLSNFFNVFNYLPSPRHLWSPTSFSTHLFRIQRSSQHSIIILPPQTCSYNRIPFALASMSKVLDYSFSQFFDSTCYHYFFCAFENRHLILSQTPCFTSVQHRRPYTTTINSFHFQIRLSFMKQFSTISEFDLSNPCSCGHRRFVSTAGI